MESIQLKVIYDGAGPVHWDGGAGSFGLQDKAEVLHPGTRGEGGTVTFDLTLAVKPRASDTPVLSGEFAHGPPADRFLYLGWRNHNGAFAQRLKLPLDTITTDDIRRARDRHQPLVGTLVDHHPKATTTGANIGGTRPISWVLPAEAA